MYLLQLTKTSAIQQMGYQQKKINCNLFHKTTNTTQYLHYTTIQLPAAISTTKTTLANFFNQWTHYADEFRKSGFILQQFCYTDLHFACQPNMLQASNTILCSGFACTGAIIRHSKRVKISGSRNASCIPSLPTRIANDLLQPSEYSQCKRLMSHNSSVHHENFQRLTAVASRRLSLSQTFCIRH